MILNLNKQYTNTKENNGSLYRETKNRFNQGYFPETFNDTKFQMTSTKNDATIKSPIKDFGLPKEDKHLTKDEMKFLLMQLQKHLPITLRFPELKIQIPLN